MTSIETVSPTSTDPAEDAGRTHRSPGQAPGGSSDGVAVTAASDGSARDATGTDRSSSDGSNPNAAGSSPGGIADPAGRFAWPRTRRTILRRRGDRRTVEVGHVGDDSGMSTVEYAIGTVAAAAFAAVLYAVVSGDSIIGALTGIVQRALSTTF